MFVTENFTLPDAVVCPQNFFGGSGQELNINKLSKFIVSACQCPHHPMWRNFAQSGHTATVLKWLWLEVSLLRLPYTQSHSESHTCKTCRTTNFEKGAFPASLRSFMFFSSNFYPKQLETSAGFALGSSE